MLRKRALLLAPDGGGGGGGITIEEENFDEAVAKQGEAAPKEASSFAPIPVEDDVEYVEEGTEARPEEPEFARGKSREELLTIVQQNQQELEAERARANTGAEAIASALRGIVPQPAQAVPVDGFRFALPQQQQVGPNAGKTPAEIKADLEARFIANPIDVLDEMTNAKMAPVVKTFGENMGLMARELALHNPDLKKVYDKYAVEVENLVAQTPVAEKLNNPRIYQNAIASVKAAHFSEFAQEEMQSQLQTMLAAELKKYGIDPQKPAQPAARPASTLASRSPGAAPGPAKRQVAIPREVLQEAQRSGKDPGMLYEYYKEMGRYPGRK